MIRSGELTEIITLQENQGAVAGLQGPIESWVTIRTPWAQVVTLTGREFVQAAAVQGEHTHRIKIRFVKGISVTTKYRVLWNSAILGVESITNTDQKNEELVLMCKQLN